MEAKTNYTIVGIFVLALIGGLIATGLWLSVGYDQKKYNYYVVYINEAVSGLSEESIVKFNGVKVGFVKKITLNRLDPQQVVLLLGIEEDIPITTSTTAMLISLGITGNVYVGLSASSPDLTPLKKLPNQLYPVIPTKASLFTQLDKVLRDVSVNVNEVSKKLNGIIDHENAENFKKTLSNIKVFSDMIAHNAKQIDQSISNANIFLKNIAQVSHDLPAIIKDMKLDARQFGKMTTSMMNTSNKISQQTVPLTNTLLRYF